MKNISDPPSRFVDRGDPATADFLIGDLNAVTTWTDLDLSAIIPGGTDAVVLAITLEDSANRRMFAFRTKGNVNQTNVPQIVTQVINQEIGDDMIVATNKQQTIQYYSNGNTNVVVNLTVKGWFQ